MLCIIHCSSLALHNAYGLLPAAKAPLLGKLLSSAPIRTYGQLSGSRTGHGFFAPQVASMFMVQLLRETPGDTIRWNGPVLRTGGGKTRYVVFLNQCQHLLPSAGEGKGNPARKRVVEATLHRMARHELPPTAYPTRCVVYAVRHVPLGTPHGAAKPTLAVAYDQCTTAIRKP
ncbi:hypothetical protein ACEVG1_02245 [Parapedobacter sp. 2B3]